MERLKPGPVKSLGMGYCLGTANIIPGVSGGTFLLIFQIYERVFEALANINLNTAAEFFRLVRNLLFQRSQKNKMHDLTAFLLEKDFIFLLQLVAGAVAAIVSLSGLMKYLLENQFSITYALFFGLILISILIPLKMLRKKTFFMLAFALLGAGLTIYVSWAVNPYEKIEKKSQFYQSVYEQEQESQSGSPALGSENMVSGGDAFPFSGMYTPDEYLYAFICGAISVSAMVLPGLSGSLVLILLGEYFAVVSAISGLAGMKLDHFLFLGCFSAGIVIGGLVFAKLISLVLEKFYNTTMAFLIGLMAGSLYALWPFKESVNMTEQYVKTGDGIAVLQNVRVMTNINILPKNFEEAAWALVFFIIGGIIMSFFVKNESA